MYTIKQAAARTGVPGPAPPRLAISLRDRRADGGPRPAIGCTTTRRSIDSGRCARSSTPAGRRAPPPAPSSPARRRPPTSGADLGGSQRPSDHETPRVCRAGSTRSSRPPSPSIPSGSSASSTTCSRGARSSRSRWTRSCRPSRRSVMHGPTDASASAPSTRQATPSCVVSPAPSRPRDGHRLERHRPRRPASPAAATSSARWPLPSRHDEPACPSCISAPTCRRPTGLRAPRIPALAPQSSAARPGPTPGPAAEVARALRARRRCASSSPSAGAAAELRLPRRLAEADPDGQPCPGRRPAARPRRGGRPGRIADRT